ncbi:unnamed protein product, partial [Prorocentrum cordatum]
MILTSLFLLLLELTIAPCCGGALATRIPHRLCVRLARRGGEKDLEAAPRGPGEAVAAEEASACGSLSGQPAGGRRSAGTPRGGETRPARSPPGGWPPRPWSRGGAAACGPVFFSRPSGVQRPG